MTATTKNDFVRTRDALPRSEEVIEAIAPGGAIIKLKRVGTLWFLADDSMYVYYTPDYWRYTTGEQP